MCQRQRRCSAPTNACPYQVVYLSNNTSTTGIVLEDVLHLITDDTQLKPVQAPIKFGYLLSHIPLLYMYQLK